MNKGMRICDKCRHFFPKSKLKISSRGQFCKECYEEYHRKIYDKHGRLEHKLAVDRERI